MPGGPSTSRNSRVRSPWCSSALAVVAPRAAPVEPLSVRRLLSNTTRTSSPLARNPRTCSQVASSSRLRPSWARFARPNQTSSATPCGCTMPTASRPAPGVPAKARSTSRLLRSMRRSSPACTSSFEPVATKRSAASPRSVRLDARAGPAAAARGSSSRASATRLADCMMLRSIASALTVPAVTPCTMARLSVRSVAPFALPTCTSWRIDRPLYCAAKAASWACPFSLWKIGSRCESSRTSRRLPCTSMATSRLIGLPP